MAISETLTGLLIEKTAARSRRTLMDGATKALRSAHYNGARLDRLYDTFGPGLSKSEFATGAHAMRRAEQLSAAADNRVSRVALNPKREKQLLRDHVAEARAKGIQDADKLVHNDTIKASDLKFQRKNRGTKIGFWTKLHDAMETAPDRARLRRSI